MVAHVAATESPPTPAVLTRARNGLESGDETVLFAPNR